MFMVNATVFLSLFLSSFFPLLFLRNRGVNVSEKPSANFSKRSEMCYTENGFLFVFVFWRAALGFLHWAALRFTAHGNIVFSLPFFFILSNTLDSRSDKRGLERSRSVDMKNGWQLLCVSLVHWRFLIVFFSAVAADSSFSFYSLHDSLALIPRAPSSSFNGE